MNISDAIHFLYGASFWGSFMSFRDNSLFLVVLPLLMIACCVAICALIPDAESENLCLLPLIIGVSSFGIFIVITVFKIMAVCIRLYSNPSESYINDIKNKGDIVTCSRCISHLSSDSLAPIVIHSDNGGRDPILVLEDPLNRYHILKAECDIKHKYYDRTCRVFLKKEGTGFIFSVDLSWFLYLYGKDNTANDEVKREQLIFEK